MHKAVRFAAVVAVSFLSLLSTGTLTAQVAPSVRNHPRALDTGTGSISLTALGTAVTENFDTLSNTAGSTTNTTLPAGWYITETGGGARDNEQYAVDTGGSTTGDIYSYGSAAATDRALGELRSGTLIPLFGAKFTNNTGATITSLDISYVGEQWRFGGVHSTVPDRLDFQYSVNATDLSTGTYLDANALDFNPPVTAGTAGALDGNNAANRTAISSTITGLSIPAGATFFIRLNDVDATGADDGLAIDNFSLTPQGAAPNTAPSITPPANPIATVAMNAAPFTVGLTGSDDGNIFNWSATPGTGVASVNVTAGQGTASVTYTVTLTAGFSGTATFTATLTDNVNTPVNQAVNITVVPPPAAPTGLAATAGTGHVALTWSTVSGATSYNVKRSTTTGTETTIASSGTNSFDDATTTNGTPFFYVVSAVGFGGESTNSSEVTATSMAAPTGLAATPGNAHVVLNWSAVAGATGYNVKRSTTTGTETTIASPATNTFDDLTAANGTAYFYVVTATNANGESIASSEVTATPAAPGILVLSQLYGGAGCGTVGCSTFKNDYIEIFNRGGSPVSVNGWSVQYASAAGTSWQVTNLPNVSIQPGQYFLVAEGAGANGVNNIPTPDATGSIAMSATAAKVALVSSTVALSGACPSTNVIDMVGFGSTATCFETAFAPAPSTTNAIFRAASGCTDAGNNSTDFAAAAAAPRNTASPTHSCGAPVNNPPAITPPANPITTVAQDAAPFTVNLTGSDDGGIYNWSATPGTGVSNVSVTGGQGTPTATFTVTLTAGFNGTATFTASLTDNVNAPVTQLVNITVTATPVPPPVPTGLAATAGNAHVALTWNASSGATSYNVKRSTTSGSGYTTIASPASPSFDDTTAANGTTYFYVVSAVGTGGESANSSEVSGTPSLPAPTGLAATPGNAQVSLTWNPVTGATTYNVKRSTTSGSGYVTIQNVAATSYTDNTAANGTTYFYVVSALAGPAEGPNSAQVQATPAAPGFLLGVAISQLYGGNGNAYSNDYVELFNRTASPVDISGYSLQYGSATGQFASVATNLFALPPGTIIGAGQYLTVKFGTAGAGLPVTADIDGGATLNMSGTSVKVAFVTSATALGCGATATPCTLPDPRIIDLVAYGTANDGEGGTTAGNGAAISASAGPLRNFEGCQDTDNNNFDFTIATTATGLAPRTAATPQHICGPLNLPPTITAPANPIATVNENAAPFTVNLTGNDDGGVYNWSATAGAGISTVTVSAGQGTANVTYTVTLQTNFFGTATFTASLSDGVNPTATRTVNISVTRDVNINHVPTITPPADPAATVAINGGPVNINITGNDDNNIYNWSASPGAGISSVIVSAGQGTPTVTYNVAIQPGFLGTASFTALLSDGVNPNTGQLVNIGVSPTGSSVTHVVISQVYGGGGNSGATYTNDFVELYNPTGNTINLGGWTVQYSSATNTGNFSGIEALGGSIGPGQYYLIKLASGGANGIALPPANVDNNSGLNLSGTAGKVALVSNASALTGTCGTLLTDPDIIDFVGYGSTANCSEGGSNAPQPTDAATAIFRANTGDTDTNVNGNDFANGPVNPRRTAPIQEQGPTVVSTDPSTNDPIAPRDANIVVTFTEPVDVTGNWYTINCTSTGNHDSATVAPAAASRIYTIVPNVNFLAGEQCTVTLFANLISDTDTDDSGPGTNNLPSDYSWTFTVSSGTAPPYPSNVHLTMGNPSNAVADDVFSPNNYLMQKPEMAISYSRDAGRPNWVSWHLTDEWFGSLVRVDTFRADPAVLPTWYRVLGSDFSGSGFDRGHMTPNADRDKETSVPINQATYLMSNMVAQAPDNNQGPWAALENDLRTIASGGNELYIVAGPNGQGGTGSNGFANTIANGHVVVPASTWKCALVLPKLSGDDVARVTASTRTICVIMPNIQGIRNDDWHIYLKSVDQVEALTGYNLYSNVPAAIQNAIEGGVDGVNPPGTANQSVSTNEEAPKSFTLDVASPNANPLTYTIETPPSHGVLTGTNGNETYTPAPDFNGTDTFTYHISDGSHTSNTSTVTIAVLEVNDPPVATDDSKSTSANVPVTFPSSDLTTNDTAGPANEAGQTLTVTTVTATGTTHGNVVLNAGQITYSPDVSFTGPASFTYQVCDNGVTAGLLDSRCSTATVNVTVTAQVTTHFSVTAPANVTSGTPFSVTVTALDASNATVTGYTGTVHFTSSSAGTLPADYTFTGVDNGAHTFNVTLTSAGPQSITATDGGITGSANTTVAPPPATHFSATAPANVGNGVPFNVTVTALDASNATVTSYTGTVHFTSSSAGTLPADYTFTGADNGAHTFSVSLTTAGAQSITAADGGITGSANTTVAPPPATHFSVTAPANVTSGTPFNVTVTALDASNATVPGYTGTVHFTSSSAGTLPGDYTFTGGDSGTHTFSVTLTTTGAQSITATDGGITGSANTTVAPPPATHFSVIAPANVTHGTAFNVTVTALDASNTIVPGYTGTVHFTSSSAGSLPADYTFTGGDAGTHTFSVTLTTNGAQSVTATDGGITGTANLTVDPLPATHFSVAAPANVNQFSPFNVTVTALDASNGTVTGYTGTVHFTSSSAGTLPGDYTFTGADNGTHTFSVTLTTTGTQTITATDTSNASITGTASTTVILVCPPGPVPSATASNSGPACAGGSVNLFATGNGTTFSWTGPGGFTSSQQNPTGITVAGTYTVTVSSPGPCGGSAQASTTVVFNPIPSATITTGGSTCVLSSGNAASVPNAGAGATYSWSITNGTITGGAGTPNILFTAGSGGSVHLAVTVSANGCSASGTADVATSGPTIALPTALSACPSATITIPFTLTGTGPWTVRWSDGQIQSGITSSPASRTFSATSSVILSVVNVTDANCTSPGPVAGVNITITGAPTITTQPTGQIVAPGTDATFTVVATGGTLHYQWFVRRPSGVTQPVGTDSPSFATHAEGNSTWFVRVSNDCGSVDSIEVTADIMTPRRHPSH